MQQDTCQGCVFGLLQCFMAAATCGRAKLPVTCQAGGMQKIRAERLTKAAPNATTKEPHPRLQALTLVYGRPSQKYMSDHIPQRPLRRCNNISSKPQQPFRVGLLDLFIHLLKAHAAPIGRQPVSTFDVSQSCDHSA